MKRKILVSESQLIRLVESFVTEAKKAKKTKDLNIKSKKK